MLIALGATNTLSKSVPTEIKILGWGETTYNGGKIILDNIAADKIVANQKALNFDRLALDFNHNSVPTSPSYTGEPISVAASADLEIRPADGLYFVNIKYTQEGKEKISNGHYWDVSPAIKKDAQNRVEFVHSAGICRQGRIPNLTLFSSEFLNTNTNMEESLKKRNSLLCMLLGLPEDCEDSALESAASALSEKLKTLDKKSVATPKGVEEFSSRLEALETVTQRQTKIALRNTAISQGKVIPESFIEMMSVQEFETFCKESPEGIVPMASRTPQGVKEFSKSNASSDSELQLCSALGITLEELNKQKEAQ